MGHLRGKWWDLFVGHQSPVTRDTAIEGEDRCLNKREEQEDGARSPLHDCRQSEGSSGESEEATNAGRKRSKSSGSHLVMERGKRSRNAGEMRVVKDVHWDHRQHSLQQIADPTTNKQVFTSC